MFLITAHCRKSRLEDRPGTVSLKLMDGEGQTAMMALGLESAKAEIMTVNKSAIEKAMKLVYIIAEQWASKGRQFSIFEIAAEFNKQYLQTDARFSSKLDAPIKYDESIARFGRGFMSGKPKEESRIIPQSTSDIIAYFEYLSDKFKVSHKLSTSRNIRSTGLRIGEFLGDKVVRLCNVDQKFIVDFNNYLSQRKMSDSTVSFYMRTMKLVLNQARSEGLIEMGDDWFQDANVHIDKSGKNSLKMAMPIETIRRFADYDFSDDEHLALARDIFMFCFYMNGMEWVDVALLTPNDILPTGYILFNRRQKGGEKRIKIGDKAQAIINKYLKPNSLFVFPMMKDNRQTSLLYARQSSTRYLKIAGKRAGISNISFTRARSTWLALTQQTNIAEQLI